MAPVLRPRRPRLAAAFVIALAATCAAAQETPPGDADDLGIAEMDLAELAEVRVVTVATGTARPLAQAPAVAAVVTAEEIEAMGASHLDEVLERVAGIHVAPSQTLRLGSVYSVRGIHAGQNAQVLVLVDGVPITQLQVGGRIFGFRLPVHVIDRIEVVRGPGSAVYGADAFAGVVNVFTKDAHDVAGTEAGARVGSFGSREAWVVGGDEWGGWDVGFALEWQTSDGDRDRRVDADFQTQLDRQLGTDASRAPGPLDTGYEVLDLHLDLQRRGWDVHLWRWTNEDAGVGAGIANALDPEGEQDDEMMMLDVVHDHAGVPDGWEVETRLSLLYLNQRATSRIFPPGAVLPVGADGNLDFFAPVNLVSFPEGVIADVADVERMARLGSVAVYEGFAGHRLRFAAGVAHEELEISERKNFGPGVTTGDETVVGGTLVDVTDTPFVFLPDQSRRHLYLSLQDEWAIGERWQLTAGVRFDDYSDFGSTVNPRVALVYAPRPGVTAKLLYGSAFRAPTFAERLSVNNPVNLGNPDLDPETIDTFELAFDLRPTRTLRTAVSLFRYEMDDLIELVPDPGTSTRTARNFAAQDGHGFEVEAEWQPRRELRVVANYAYQRAEDAASERRIAGPPEDQVHLAVEWRPRPPWSVYAAVDRVGERVRPAGDPRPTLDAYTHVGASLRRRVGERFELGLVARNLFDETAFEPSTPGIPGDYPLPGRSVLLEVGARF